MSRSENDKGAQPVDEEDNEKDNEEVEQLADKEEEGVLGVLVVQVHLVQHFLGGSTFSGQVFHGALCQKMIL